MATTGPFSPDLFALADRLGQHNPQLHVVLAVREILTPPLRARGDGRLYVAAGREGPYQAGRVVQLSGVDAVLDRRRFIAALTGGLFAAPLAVEAQSLGRVAKVGILSTVNPRTKLTKLLGLTIPRSLQQRADQVIE
jgi:hypothetical protein